MMQVRGTTVIDTATSERYEFQTTEFAYAFAAMWNKYEMDKLLSSGTTVPFNGDISVAPARYLQFNLGGKSYRLDMKRKPTILLDIFLRMIGFKQI